MDIEKSAASLTEALGKVLLQYRTENNLTREDLAKTLDLSEGRIRQLENGDNAKSFRIELLLSVASALKMSAHDLLRKVMEESKLLDSKAAENLRVSFSTAAQTFATSVPFNESVSQEDEIFGNHFVWSLRMAELMLQLDNPAKARMEMALRRAAPKRTLEEYKKRMEHLLEYDLDN